MKIVKIMGGLGNQMFQYAFYKVLQDRFSEEDVYIDISSYSQRKTMNGINLVHNGFELEKVFSLQEGKDFLVAADKDVRKLSTQPVNIIKRVLRKYFTKKTHFIDTGFALNPAVLDEVNAGKDCYYEGYWQTEKYFCAIEDIIRKSFKFRQNVSEKNRQLMESLKKDSLSIHVRRGDYLNSPNHNVCSEVYYLNAVKAFFLEHSEENFSPDICVFSDDISWCRNELRLENFIKNVLNRSFDRIIYVDWNRKDDSWQDMAVMKECSEHIIANSSFSWWSVWLDDKTGKKIYAPEVWDMRELNDTDHHYNYGDIVPSYWKRIPI